MFRIAAPNMSMVNDLQSLRPDPGKRPGDGSLADSAGFKAAAHP